MEVNCTCRSAGGTDVVVVGTVVVVVVGTVVVVVDDVIVVGVVVVVVVDGGVVGVAGVLHAARSSVAGSRSRFIGPSSLSWLRW